MLQLQSACLVLSVPTQFLRQPWECLDHSRDISCVELTTCMIGTEGKAHGSLSLAVVMVSVLNFVTKWLHKVSMFASLRAVKRKWTKS
jgi:hypothetical protein